MLSQSVVLFGFEKLGRSQLWVAICRAFGTSDLSQRRVMSSLLSLSKLREGGPRREVLLCGWNSEAEGWRNDELFFTQGAAELFLVPLNTQPE